MEITNRGISRLVAGETTCEGVEMIARLEGVLLNSRQRFAAAVVGASMTAFDSVFDDLPLEFVRLDGAKALAAVDGGDASELGSRLQRGIAIAHDNFTEPAMGALKDLAKAQFDSIRQREAGVAIDVVRDITKRKGAQVMLMLALQVNPNMSQERRKCFEELGFFVQLVDDYEDQSLDAERGVSTLITFSETCYEKSSSFEETGC